MTADMRFERIKVGDVELNVASAGDPSKPLVICLHGFPEYWAAWKDVMEHLAHDFHVVAPDQRGFNLSSRPENVEAYRAKRLVADIAGLADRLAPGRPFALAGHDWGASVAYAYAFAHPDRVSHLVIANGVHPACFQRAIFDVPEQQRASQYINRLRAADAEAVLSEDGYRRLFNMLAGFSKTDWMTAEAKAAYLEAWRQPGALTGMLNWYRASPVVVPALGEEAPRSTIEDIAPEAMRVRMPHLVIWGEEDEALRPACLDGLDRFAPDLTIERIAGAGHWILHEKPGDVAKAMRRFLAGHA